MQPSDPCFVAECLLERGAEHDADVFHRVVEVDLEVAAGDDAQVEPAVLAQLLEHVVEEGDAGGSRRDTLAVDVEHELDGRFLGGVLLAARRFWTSHCDLLEGRTSAARNASAAVPMVTRRQPASRASRRSCAPAHPVRPGAPKAWPSLDGRKSRKLAPDGKTVMPSTPASLADARSCSATRRRTRSAISAPSSSASRPAIWVADARWYGSTTFSSSWTTHGGVTAKPSRSVAIDHTFE